MNRIDSDPQTIRRARARHAATDVRLALIHLQVALQEYEERERQARYDAPGLLLPAEDTLAVTVARIARRCAADARTVRLRERLAP